MRYLTVIEILAIIPLSYILVFIFLKKNYFIYLIIALTLFWGALGILGFKYITVQQFRLSFDLIFNQVVEHKDSFEKGILVLPLPKHTAFAYRSSDNAATYFTTLSEDDIIKFFKELASKDSFLSEDSNLNYAKKILKFTYKNTPYFVGLRRSIKPEGYYIYVESKINQIRK